VFLADIAPLFRGRVSASSFWTATLRDGRSGAPGSTSGTAPSLKRRGLSPITVANVANDVLPGIANGRVSLHVAPTGPPASLAMSTVAAVEESAEARKLALSSATQQGTFRIEAEMFSIGRYPFRVNVHSRVVA